MSDQYDVIVLGSGPGGYVAAIRASQLGLKTAIVEREALGGICLNWGCIPTKALLRSAEVFHQMKHAKAYGLSAEGVSADLGAIVQRSRGVASQLNKGVTGLMKKNKVDVHMGTGKLISASKVTVTDGEGKSKDEFVRARTERDGQLAMPKLIIPSLQVNMRAGQMPQAEDNGVTY
ncbi:MAG TPA: FAD-dependent oxidoreductase, partial [Novosphingobium sp.]|nr:FAD-dependent oxidoreductase [Novosphingobium sp.]